MFFLQLIGGLADEKGRWQESVDFLEKVINQITGDVLISAGYIAYLGPFTVGVILHYLFPLSHSSLCRRVCV